MPLHPPGPPRRVAIVGAGVVGLSCALWLQRCGHTVTLVDREPPAAGAAYTGAASFGNACTMAFGACIPVASPGVLARVPAMLLERRSPLAIFWRDLPRLLPWLAEFVRASTPAQVERITAVLGGLLRLAEAGHAPLIEASRADALIRRAGCLYLYKTPRSFAAAQREIALRARERVGMEILDAEAVRAAEPALAPLYHKAVRFTDTYFVDDPRAYALALAETVRRQGGTFVRGEAAGIAGTPEHVDVHLGTRVLQAERVVLAAGAWSGRLAASVGDRLRLDTERGYHVMFPDGAGLLGAPCCYPEHGFYMTPLRSGLRAAGTVELGGLGRPPRPVRTDTIAAVARTLVPGLSRAGSDWLGFRPSMPDSLPAIGPSPADARVIHAVGHGHIGLTLAGITGRIVCDLIDGRAPPLDITPLRPTRFA
ncbi:NAD(P)/FAD-dependent oxidoreductase [Verticiella sediminum]|uniref:NAD(P)/FAD-dependent oxidoreductase n=1 Tax=Verticiella sediminum TaxID=1247510 RepID=UPI001B85E2B6|nr:FAD-dependent oxidoreductase [Verticiella sediminum]